MYTAVFLCLQEETEEIKSYQSVIEGLHEQAANLGEQVRSHPWDFELLSSFLYSLFVQRFCY